MSVGLQRSVRPSCRPVPGGPDGRCPFARCTFEAVGRGGGDLRSRQTLVQTSPPPCSPIGSNPCAPYTASSYTANWEDANLTIANLENGVRWMPPRCPLFPLRSLCPSFWTRCSQEFLNQNRCPLFTHRSLYRSLLISRVQGLQTPKALPFFRVFWPPFQHPHLQETEVISCPPHFPALSVYSPINCFPTPSLRIIFQINHESHSYF